MEKINMETIINSKEENTFIDLIVFLQKRLVLYGAG